MVSLILRMPKNDNSKQQQQVGELLRWVRLQKPRISCRVRPKVVSKDRTKEKEKKKQAKMATVKNIKIKQVINLNRSILKSLEHQNGLQFLINQTHWNVTFD